MYGSTKLLAEDHLGEDHLGEDHPGVLGAMGLRNTSNCANKLGEFLRRSVGLVGLEPKTLNLFRPPSSTSLGPKPQNQGSASADRAKRITSQFL